MWDGGEAAFRQRVPEADFGFAYGLGEAAEAIGDAEVVLTFGLDKVCVERAASLKWLQTLGSGVDGVRAAARRWGAAVTNAHGLHAPAVAEAAIASMLALARHLPQAQLSQAEHRWAPETPALLHGSNVGIVGTGEIACAVGRRLSAFDARTTGFSASPRAVEGFDVVLPRTDLISTAPELDYVVLLAPLTDETRGLADGRLFAAMKPSAFLVNFGRGGLVDEPALIAALAAGDIGGAALDVFQEEPLPPQHPLWMAPRLIITAHTGGRRKGYLAEVIEIFAANMEFYRAGRPLPGTISV